MEEQVQTTQKSGAKAFFADCWHNRQKRVLSTLCICIVLILIATLFGSWIQTAGWKYEVEDLRNASAKVTFSRAAISEDPDAAPKNISLTAKVGSGLLFTPKKVAEGTKLPAVVLTHGLYNNREMQLQNAIELVRRGFVVLSIDHGDHGHYVQGVSASSTYMPFFDATTFVQAAAYLCSLPYVDQTKIGVSGHSMGGSATASALSADGVTAKNQTEANFKAWKGLGIISAGLVQANNAPSTLGSNVIAAGIIKASSDEFFFSSGTLPEKVYLKVAKTSVNETNYTNYYLKVGGEYVKQTAEDKFKSGKQYYNLAASGSSHVYLFGANAKKFVGATDAKEVINGAVYANGAILAQPEQKAWRTWDTESKGQLVNTVPKKGTLVSVQTKGEALASATQSIRVIYEAKETHPMNHFSIQSAAHVVDFFYNAFGTPDGAKFIAPANQTWWLKEGFAILGFIGMFGLLFPVLDILLGTKVFASLKADEGEILPTASLLKNPRKHVSYWLSGILTAVFGAISLKNIHGTDKWRIYDSLVSMMSDTSKFIFNDTVAKFAAWGIMCAVFAVCLTAAIWFINKILDTFLGEKLGEEAGHPFAGFQIRSIANIFKTLILAVILLVTFYGVQNLIWAWTKVDFRFWTFDLRVFDLIRVPAMLKYVPFFFLFYMVTSAFSQNYRVKDLPEWATIAINVCFNVIGVIILLWNSNDYFIRTGAQIATSNLFYIAAIPIIPCVGFATVVARRMYVRTGNAWLAGIVNAVIMTFIACANTSIVGVPAWTLGA